MLTRTTRLVQEVMLRGGVARTATLRARGVTRYDIRQAITVSAVFAVRQGWIALPQADPMLIDAAGRGVVLTCVTQARRMGLWVHEEETCRHVGAAPRSAVRKDPEVRIHWAKPLIPRHPDSLVDPIVLPIDGSSHVGAQRSEDIRHDAELRLLGYHVIRVSYVQVVEGWNVVQDLIMRAVAQGLHVAAHA